MKKKGLLLLSVILAVTVSACGSSSASKSTDSGYATDDYDTSYSYADTEDSIAGDSYWDDEDSAYEEDVEENSTDETSETETTSETENTEESENTKKIVYTADLTMQTLTYDKAVKSIAKRIDSYGGFIESQNETNDNGYWYRSSSSTSKNRRYADYVIRIPSKNFNDFIDSLEGYGQITGKSVQAENISQRYYETKTTIQALEKEEERLLAMMDQAATVDEMISVEKRLTEVETQLSQYKTSLSSMDKDVEYSTINLSLEEVFEYTEPEPETFGSRFVSAITGSLESFLNFLQGLLIVIVYLLPYLILIFLIILVIRLLIKKGVLKRKKKEKQEKKERRFRFRRKERTPENTETIVIPEVPERIAPPKDTDEEKGRK